MKKFWSVFAIWSLLLAISTVIMLRNAHEYEMRQASLRTVITEVLSKKMTYHEAFNDSFYVAIDFEFADSKRKEKMLKEYPIQSFDYDRIDWDAKKIRNQKPIYLCVAVCEGILVLIGIGCSITHFFIWLINWFKTRVFLQRHLLKALSFGLVSGINLWTIAYFTQRDNHFNFKQTGEFHAIDEAYSATYSGLIELSNEFIVLDGMRDINSIQWFSQVGYIKKKTVALLEKLKGKKENNIVKYGIQICENILKWAELSTDTEKNPTERMKRFGEGGAEFKTMLDVLDELSLKTFQGEWGLFPKYYPSLFSDEAMARYKDMTNNEKYSVYLIFGYRLYDLVVKRLETEKQK